MARRRRRTTPASTSYSRRTEDVSIEFSPWLSALAIGGIGLYLLLKSKTLFASTTASSSSSSSSTSAPSDSDLNSLQQTLMGVGYPYGAVEYDGASKKVLVYSDYTKGQLLGSFAWSGYSNATMQLASLKQSASSVGGWYIRG